MNHIRRFLFFVAFCFLGVSGFSQTPLPTGYGDIKLGMSVEEVKNALKKDSDFGYKGDRDVSLLPGENRILIETDASVNAPWSYFSNCYFQFYAGKLYIIILDLNRKKIDRYSVFTALCKKYGDPISLSPEKSLWQDENVRMSLESPLSVKYIDEKVFEQLQKKSLVEKSTGEMSKDTFLEGL